MTDTDTTDPAEGTDTVTGDTDTTAEPAAPAQPPPGDLPPRTKLTDQGRIVETEPPSGSREARYRTQLRATEAERDQLRSRLETRDRADVERDLAGRLVDPADLWRGGIELDQLRGADNELDPDLIDQAVQAVLAEHPHWGIERPSPAAPASAVTWGATKPETPEDVASFTDAFRPKTH